MEGGERVTGRTDKVEASMHTEIRLVGPHRLLLLSHICLVLVVDEVNDGGPRVAVVDVVTETGSINNRQLGFELLLFQLCLDDFNLCQLVELFEVTTVVILWGRQLGGE